MDPLPIPFLGYASREDGEEQSRAEILGILTRYKGAGTKTRAKGQDRGRRLFGVGNERRRKAMG